MKKFFHMKKVIAVLGLLLTLNLVVAESVPEVILYEEQKTTKSIIYPNPARDFAVVRNTSDVEIKNITILSIVGSSVLSQDSNNNGEEQLNLTRIRSGRYFVKVTYADGYKEILNLIKL